MDLPCRILFTVLLFSLTACDKINIIDPKSSDQDQTNHSLNDINSRDGFTISGTISVGDNTYVDSDINDIRSAPVNNNYREDAQFLSTPPIHLVGYLNEGGKGADGHSKQNGDLQDRFKINALGGERITLDIPNISSADDSDPNVANLDLFLYDNSYNLIGSAMSISGADESLVIPEQSGTYYIMVSLFRNYSYSGLYDTKSTYKLIIDDHSANVQSINMDWTTASNFQMGEIIVKQKAHCLDQSTNNKIALQKTYPTKYKNSNSRLSLYRLEESAINQYVTFQPITTAMSVNQIKQSNVSEIQLKTATLMAARDMANQPCVEYAEPNYIRHSMIVPNDEKYAEHWQYPIISLPDAWDTTTGSDQIKVAIIDTGVLMTHSDLHSRLTDDGYDFISEINESGDGDGIDANPADPGDGFENQNCNFSDRSNNRSSFHGTRVAGVVGATADNGIGLTGVDWNAKIMPLRVLGCQGASDYSIAQAVLYAAGLENDSGIKVSDPADIINLSVGNIAKGETLANAINQAIAAGTIVIASAGNSNSSTPIYPAAFPNVISVAATDTKNQKASFSNYGPSIDVAAPGTSIWSTAAKYENGSPEGFYKSTSGTSLAAPHIAGVASLMKSIYSAMTPDDFEAILISGKITDDLGESGRDDKFGYGLINAKKAVEFSKQINDSEMIIPITPIIGLNKAYINLGASYKSAQVTVSNVGSKNSTIANIEIETSDDFVTVKSASNSHGMGDYIINIDRSGLVAGNYQSSVRFISDAGEKTVILLFRVLGIGERNYGNAGNLSLHLTNINTKEVTKLYIKDSYRGKYSFKFSGVAAGNYKLKVGNDLDNNGILCEVAEGCGQYGNDTMPLRIDRQINNLQIKLEY